MKWIDLDMLTLFSYSFIPALTGDSLNRYSEIQNEWFQRVTDDIFLPVISYDFIPYFFSSYHSCLFDRMCKTNKVYSRVYFERELLICWFTCLFSVFLCVFVAIAIQSVFSYDKDSSFSCHEVHSSVIKE